jgi:hypothetical protein
VAFLCSMILWRVTQPDESEHSSTLLCAIMVDVHFIFTCCVLVGTSHPSIASTLAPALLPPPAPPPKASSSSASALSSALPPVSLACPLPLSLSLASPTLRPCAWR